ncbi:hypothetical protein D3C76_1241260 [compost metagenome]
MAVELEGVDRQVAQHAQRAIASTEIVEGDTHAQLTQLVQLLQGHIVVDHQRSLGNLDLKLRRVKALAGNHPSELLDQVGHGKLHAAEADPQHQARLEAFLPVTPLRHALGVDPAGQARNQSRLFQQGQKQPWRYIADAGMLPAQ